MRDDIIKYLCKEVERRCQMPSNYFGMGCFYHIQAVVNHSEVLAETYNGDKEIVIIAAWLHDIASITDYDLYENNIKTWIRIVYMPGFTDEGKETVSVSGVKDKARD